MNFHEFLASPLIERLGWMLLHSLWQAAAIAAVTGLAMVLLRRRSPQARYALACAGLVLTLAACAATFATVKPAARIHNAPVVEAVAPPDVNIEPAPMLGESEPPLPTVGSRAPLVQVREQETVIAGSQQRLTASRRPAPVELAESPALPGRGKSALKRVLPWVAIAWLTGLALLGVWRLGGWVAAERLRVIGARPAGAQIEATFRRLAERLGLRRVARVVESLIVAAPMVIGWIRPVVLLPASAVSGLTAGQLEAVLAHELAHIRRHDCLANLLQTLIETLLFYHPAVWWLSARVRAEREHCCDDQAVAVCPDRYGYAEALAAVAEIGRRQRTALFRVRRVQASPAAAATGGNLLERIGRIVGLPTVEGPRRSSWLVGALILAGVLIAIPLACRQTQPGQHVTVTPPEGTPAPPATQPSATIATGMPLQAAVDALKSARAREAEMDMAPPESRHGGFMTLRCFELADGRVVSLLADKGADSKELVLVEITVCDEPNRPKAERVERKVDTLDLRKPAASQPAASLTSFGESGQFGFKDASGKVVVKPIYDAVGEFRCGLARVNIGRHILIPARYEEGRWGYIDADGKVVVPVTLQGADDFSEGLALVRDQQGARYIAADGTTAIKLPEAHSAGCFSEGVAPIHIDRSSTNKGWQTQFIDKRGDKAFAVDGYAEEFHDGLAVLIVKDKDFVASNEGSKYGFINRDGKVAISPQFAEAKAFSEGLAAVRPRKTTVYGMGDTWGYIDKEGRYVIKPRFNEARPFRGGVAEVHVGGTLEERLDQVPHWKGGEWQLVDHQGNVRPATPATQQDNVGARRGRWTPTGDYPGGIIEHAEKDSRRDSSKPWSFEGVAAKVFTNGTGRYRVTWVRKDPLRDSYWYAWYEFKGQEPSFGGRIEIPSGLTSLDIRQAPGWDFNTDGDAATQPEPANPAIRKPVEQLADPDATVRLAAIRELQVLGSGAAPALPALRAIIAQARDAKPQDYLTYPWPDSPTPEHVHAHFAIRCIEDALKRDAAARKIADTWRAHLDSFKATLSITSGQPVGLYDLTLHVAPLDKPVRPRIEPVPMEIPVVAASAQISKAAAGRLIDYLLASRLLMSFPPGGAGEHAWLEVNPDSKDRAGVFVGWGPEMLVRLDGLRKVLDGDAGKAMDELLKRLEPHRKEWEKTAPAATQADWRATAEAFVDLLMARKFDQAVKEFGGTVSPQELEKNWDRLVEGGGPVKTRGRAFRIELINGYSTIHVPVRCERKLLGVDFGIDESGHISGHISVGVRPPHDDWPVVAPKQPPLDPAFEKFSPQELIPYVMGEKTLPGTDLEGPDGLRLACSWFVWKTREGEEGQRLRVELAGRIMALFERVEKSPEKSLHDTSVWASFMAPLGAREEIIARLRKVKSLDCCYGPALVSGLADCGRPEDIPVLIEAAAKETEACAPIVNTCLEELAGVKMPTKAGPRTDQAAWQAWWDRNKGLLPGGSPATQPAADKAVKELKAGADSMVIGVMVGTAEADKTLGSTCPLTLSVPPFHREGVSEAPGQFNAAGFGPGARLSTTQAGAVVDALARIGLLSRADRLQTVDLPPDYSKKREWKPVEVAVCIRAERGYTVYLIKLDWGPRVLDCLDAIRDALDGRPRQAVDDVLARLADQREEWNKPVSTQPEAEWGRAVEGLQTRLTLDAREATVGGPVYVHLDVRNAGDKPVELAFVKHLSRLLRVRGADGADTPTIDKSEANVINSTYALEPGKQDEVISDRLDLRFDLSQPGEYTIQWVGVPAKFAPKGQVPPVSNVVRLKIVAAAPAATQPAWRGGGEWSKPSGGLATRLAVPGRTLSLAGKPIPMRVELRNVGDKPVRYYDARDYWAGAITVTDRTGKELPFLAGPVSTTSGGPTLKPGEQVVLGREFDLTSCYYLRKPGTYAVRYAGERAFSDDDYTPIPPSPALEIEVIDDEAARADGDPVGMLLAALPADWSLWGGTGIGSGLHHPGTGWSRVPGSYVRLVHQSYQPKGPAGPQGVAPIVVWLTLDRAKEESWQPGKDPWNLELVPTEYLGGNRFYHVYVHVPESAATLWPTAAKDIAKALSTDLTSIIIPGYPWPRSLLLDAIADPPPATQPADPHQAAQVR